MSRRGLGGDGDAGSLTPRCSATPIHCMRCVAWTDTSHKHRVRITTTTLSLPIPPHHHQSSEVCTRVLRVVIPFFGHWWSPCHSPLAYVDGEEGQVRWRTTMASTSTWTSSPTPTPTACAGTSGQRRDKPLPAKGHCGASEACNCAVAFARSLVAILFCWVRRRNTHSD